MNIKRSTYQRILNAFPSVPPEAGCILGSVEDVVCAFEYDSGISSLDMAVYTPNVELLNRTIREWSFEGMKFCGLAHSHPYGQKSLSGSDVDYIKTIMRAMPASVNKLYFPLVFPGEEIVSFVAVRQQNEIEILPDDIEIK